jgi:hypothetical protein
MDLLPFPLANFRRVCLRSALPSSQDAKMSRKILQFGSAVSEERRRKINEDRLHKLLGNFQWKFNANIFLLLRLTSETFAMPAGPGEEDAAAPFAEYISGL